MLGLIGLVLSACATAKPHEGEHRGSVVMKTEGGEAHVCLGNKQVAVGDAVRVVRHECVAEKVAGGRASGAAEFRCRPRTIGTGTIRKVYDAHYSVASFPEGVDFKEGDTVEKAASRSE